MDSKLTGHTIIRTNLQFIIMILIIIVGWAISYTTMSYRVNTNGVHVHSVQERVDVLEEGNTTTLVELAKIQTTLKSIELTLEELKDR